MLPTWSPSRQDENLNPGHEVAIQGSCGLVPWPEAPPHPEPFVCARGLAVWLALRRAKSLEFSQLKFIILENGLEMCF